jgi:membrane-associated phospholipid phosphatase
MARARTLIVAVVLCLGPAGFSAAWAEDLLALPPHGEALALPEQATGGGATQQPPQPDPEANRAERPDRGFFSTLFHNLGDDVKHMPRRNSVYWLVAGTGAALAIHPADDEITNRLGPSDTAETFFKAGKYIGASPTILAAAVTTYVVGRTKNSSKVKHLGMDLIEATIISEVLTQGVKRIARRDRPLHPDGTRNSGFSFPSGHATITFAAATVFQQHLGWRVAVPTYLVATYVAMSRIHDYRHFASDVVFGAADGIIIGRSITWHGRNFYASPVLVPRGAGLMVSLAH